MEEVEAPVFDRSRRGAVALMVSVNIREHSPPAIRDSVARKVKGEPRGTINFINFPLAEVNSGAAIVTFARRRFFADLDIEGEFQRSCV